jgi:hypothetical protein
MLRKAKSTKPVACAACQGTDLIRRITTYPVRLTGPLEGKQIHVGRVALHECQTCGHLMPTPAGQAKVDRNVSMGIRLFLGQLP